MPFLTQLNVLTETFLQSNNPQQIVSYPPLFSLTTHYQLLISVIVSQCVDYINECLEISAGGVGAEGEVEGKGNTTPKFSSKNIPDISMVLFDESIRRILMTLISHVILNQRSKSRFFVMKTFTNV
jgi:hypothetical protein